MIPKQFIEAWWDKAPWEEPYQVEQDLIISRALIDLYNNDHIKNALVFRGGTALNKLFIKPPSRYSEDIDLVQKNPEPIGKTIDTIREVLKPWLGEPKWKITQRSAKLIYKYESIGNTYSKLKIEINNTEHFQVLPLQHKSFYMQSGWYSGRTDIITYEIDELMATKLKALYQRRKGRDLFDLWYVVKNNLVNLERVFNISSKYCSHDNTSFTKEEFTKNLELKYDHESFRRDMDNLLPKGLQWDFDSSYNFVIHNIINKIPA